MLEYLQPFILDFCAPCPIQSVRKKLLGWCLHRGISVPYPRLLFMNSVFDPNSNNLVLRQRHNVCCIALIKILVLLNQGRGKRIFIYKGENKALAPITKSWTAERRTVKRPRCVLSYEHSLEAMDVVLPCIKSSKFHLITYKECTDVEQKFQILIDLIFWKKTRIPAF